MAQLSFDYDSRSNEKVAYYGGDCDIETATHRVRAVQDDSPENPFTSWDGHWPMIVDYQERSHRFTDYDKCKGASLDDPIARFSDGQLIKHQGAIIAAIGGRYYNPLTGDYGATVQDDFAAHKRDYRSDYVAGREGMAALIRDYCSDALQAVSDGDKLETFAALYDLLRIPNLCTSSHGYSQGDYAELLIVATPEAQSEFGWKAGQRKPDDFAKDMAAQKALYSAWAWGDVYGAIVERAPSDPDERDDGDAWEELESCWGFYGDDFDKSGLAEFALSSIRADMADCKAKRFGKLKELIRANAPLAARAAVLGAMPC